VFRLSSLGSYFAGIATVVIALGAGFAGGALVGSSWGGIERPPAAPPNEYRVIASVREIPLVQTVSQPPPPDEQALAAQALAQANAIKVAAARKEAAKQRKVARAEQRKNAERSRQIALVEAARKIQASEIGSTKSEELKTPPGLGFAPQVYSQPIVRE
jgi:hypothetical protein